MATTRIKDISKTTTDLASDTYGVFDGATNGTQKMARNDMYADWAAAYVAAPTTYKLAPLNSGTNKIDATYLPTSGDTPKGEWNANTNSPALADGSGTAGDYYDVTTAGSQDLGSGSIAYTVGDVVKYNGSTWYKIDSVANILDGSATAADGRSTLSVNSIDEDAQANALKTTAPALYFNGTSSVVTVADSDKLSFGDGTTDRPFSLTGWVKSDEIGTDEIPIASKYVGSASGEYYLIITSGGYLRLLLRDASAGVNAFTTSNADLTAHNGKWVHVAASFSGDDNTFALYVNGAAVAKTDNVDGSYVAMENLASPFNIGKRGTTDFLNGEIKQVTLHNRELTTDEIAELARGNDLGFADEFGGALGGVYTQDSTPSGEWTASQGTDADEAGPIGGVSNVLKYTSNTNNAAHYLQLLQFSTGKRHRVEFDYYIPSGQSNIDGIDVDVSGQTSIFTAAAPTLDAWNSVSFECVPTGAAMLILATDGGVRSFADAGGDDVFYVANCKITEIGTLASFSAERYDTSTNKLYDISDNAFVGTGTSVSLTGREVPVYETGTWTGVYEPTTGSFATMTMDTDLIYTRIGNLVTITGSIQTDNVDTTGGSGSLKITGLPFFAAKVSTCQIGFAWNWGTNFPLNAIVSGSTIYLYTRSSTTARTDDILVTDLSTGAVANRNTLYISATYKIQ
jgi:hypothetical protein